ncbi:MAG: AAA family ATPase [Caldilineaceae bacterium]
MAFRRLTHKKKAGSRCGGIFNSLWPPAKRSWRRIWTNTWIYSVTSAEQRHRVSLYDSLDPAELRQQIFVNVRTLIHLASQNGPLILLLDDLHWIDPMSADLLLFLSSLVVSSPVLFICTQRSQPGQLPAPLRRIQSLYPVYNLHVHVQPLNRAESQALIDDLVKQTSLPPDVCDTILMRSNGNPYFLKSLCARLWNRTGWWLCAR